MSILHSLMIDADFAREYKFLRSSLIQERRIRKTHFGELGNDALILHRIAHRMNKNHPIKARKISEFCAICTGVDIHPKADIGVGVAVEALGYTTKEVQTTVIGETAKVGTSSVIHFGVIIGASDVGTQAWGSEDKDPTRRHPVLGTEVIVKRGAHILGSIKIGDYATIGEYSLVLGDVPPQRIINPGSRWEMHHDG